MDFRRGMGVLFVIAFCLISLRYSLDRFAFFQSGWPALFVSGKTVGVFLAWLVLWLHLRRGRKVGRKVPERKDVMLFAKNRLWIGIASPREK
jgi:hypothetical protein